MGYYLHDKRLPGDAAHPTTSERVVWTEIRNLPVEDPHFATRLMITTASQADKLKQRAGIKATGRRSTKAVYAFSLSWHPDEAAGLDKSEMIRAADAANTTPLVRVAMNIQQNILRYLDMGALGVQLPLLNNKADVESVVQDT